MQQTQRVHSSNLQAIQHQLAAHPEEATLPEGITLPLKTMKDFDDLEEKLNDDAVKKALVSSFQFQMLTVICVLLCEH